MPTNDVSQEGPLADPPSEQALEADAERLAKETDVILKRIDRARVKTWADWMQIAERLDAIAKLAMRLTGTSNRGPGLYVPVMSRLLAKHALGERKQLRAALLGIWENREAVEAMRANWRADELLKWAAPTTVWDKFNNRNKSAAPRIPNPFPNKLGHKEPVSLSLRDATAPPSLDAENTELRAEIAGLRVLVEQPLLGMTPPAIGHWLVEHLSPDDRATVVAILLENTTKEMNNGTV